MAAFADHHRRRRFGGALPPGCFGRRWGRQLAALLGGGGCSAEGTRHRRYRLRSRDGRRRLLVWAAPATRDPAARTVLAALAASLGEPLPPVAAALAALAPASVWRHRPPGRLRPTPAAHLGGGWGPTGSVAAGLPGTAGPGGARCWGWGSCRLLLPPLAAAATPERWCQWLAGVIDGDGHLRVGPGNRRLLTVAGHSEEEPGLLSAVQRLVGHGGLYGAGPNSRRAGKELTYRLTEPTSQKVLLERCGSRLQNPERRAQAAAVAAALGVALPPQRPATAAWALGYLEADGTLVLQRKGGQWPLRLAVSSTVAALPRTLAELFGGAVDGPLLPNRQNAKLQWTWRLDADGPPLEALLEAWGRCPYGGFKGARLPLVATYLGLRRAGAYRPDSPHHPAWKAFRHRWRELRGGAERELPADPPRRRGPLGPAPPPAFGGDPNPRG